MRAAPGFAAIVYCKVELPVPDAGLTVSHAESLATDHAQPAPVEKLKSPVVLPELVEPGR